jgi:hypothetical protein
MLAELQGNLASATGENRDNIASTLSDLGIDMTNTSVNGTLEQQLARQMNARIPGGSTVTAEQIGNYARTWGSGTPRAETVDRDAPKPAPPGATT